MPRRGDAHRDYKKRTVYSFTREPAVCAQARQIWRRCDGWCHACQLLDASRVTLTRQGQQLDSQALYRQKVTTRCSVAHGLGERVRFIRLSARPGPRLLGSHRQTVTHRICRLVEQRLGRWNASCWNAADACICICAVSPISIANLVRGAAWGRIVHRHPRRP